MQLDLKDVSLIFTVSVRKKQKNMNMPGGACFAFPTPLHFVSKVGGTLSWAPPYPNPGSA